MGESSTEQSVGPEVAVVAGGAVGLKGLADADPSALSAWASWGFLIVCFLLLLYYGYSRFSANRALPPSSKSDKAPDQDLVKNFNLLETIRDIELDQEDILKGLSGDVGI
jgi:hypothetical protein